MDQNSFCFPLQDPRGESECNVFFCLLVNVKNNNNSFFLHKELHSIATSFTPLKVAKFDSCINTN